MSLPAFYYIMAFDTTTDAMAANRAAQEQIRASIMPTPREISVGCGLTLRFLDYDLEEIRTFCRTNHLCGTLYKYYVERICGKHTVERLTF